jgi:universal stress protein A
MQQEYGSRMGEKINYQLVVLDGHISTEILKFLDEHQIDLVLVGSYGLSGMGLVFFGSVAKRIANKAPCSVVIVRQREAFTAS